MSLNLRAVAAVKPRASRYTVWDGDMAGFGLRVTPSGALAYVLKYRTREGRQRFYVIGRHGSPWTPEAARREARRLLGEVADGGDPSATKSESRAAVTLAAFADRYLADHAATKKKASSARMDRINLANHVLPALGRRTLAEIGRADVARFHASLRATPGAANRCLALLSKMMNLAERWGLRPDGSNPCRHVEKYPERPRKRFLSPEELARLGEACAQAERDGSVPLQFVALVRLLIFTGARLSEIQKARWDWIDCEAGVLRLPDSKTGDKEVMIPAPALEVLASLPRDGDNPHVIPGGRGDAPLVNVWKFWHRLRARAGLPNVRLHDLRHSYASVAAAGGLSLNLIGDLLGHTQAQTTKRYAHVANDPLLAAANRVAGTIAAAMKGGAGDVVPMRRR